MTAVLAERRSVPQAPRAGMTTDLWFPGQQDPTAPMGNPPDPDRFIVWVPTGRNEGELAPRKALHVGLRPSPRIHDCDGCRP